ncbi:MAG: hypothetical protein AUG02_01570 [Chloroflexi bacterium 13_1_20CM_2_70_9]|nr:MAG: hypothetical protein AUG02_01570 [Chloroflexi bacterium 13_1_20CM_2_70_9]
MMVLGNGTAGVSIWLGAEGPAIQTAIEISGNTIGNNARGIEITRLLGGLVVGNGVGVTATGAPAPQTGSGIVLDNAAQAQILSNVVRSGALGVHLLASFGNLIKGNDIRLNKNAGVFVDTGSQRNTIKVDIAAITNNGTQGIRLAAGANGGIAAPIVTAAGPSRTGLLVKGTAQPFAEVDIHVDPADEGGLHIGTTTADGNGNWSKASWGALDVAPILAGLKAGTLFARATQTDDLGNTSEFSSIGPGFRNHTWVSALLLTDGVGIDDGIGKANQSTWYRIPIGPQMHVKVDLTNLGANESLTLYRDIRMVARAMRQHANTLAQIRQNTSGNISADDIDSDDIDSDDIDSDDIDSGTLVADDIDSDDIDSDDIDSDDIDSDDIDSDDIDSDDIDSNGNGDTGFGPVYSSAERKALRALSANQGLAPESITFNTRDLTGDLYIRVRGHHGAFNDQQAFHIVATRLPDVSCAGAVAKNLLVARAPSTDPLSFPTNAHTLMPPHGAQRPRGQRERAGRRRRRRRRRERAARDGRPADA